MSDSPKLIGATELWFGKSPKTGLFAVYGHVYYPQISTLGIDTALKDNNLIYYALSRL